MLYIEYDWCFGVYRLRFGSSFISLADGERSWETKREAQEALRRHGLLLSHKTDSRTWAVKVEHPVTEDAE